MLFVCSVLRTFLFFFFQAEDGIRDVAVTGVQTCALPIFFLIKSIVGAIVGQSTNTWFKKTKMGMWFYKKMDSCYNWAAKRYDIDVLTKEEKEIKKFPALTTKIDKLEDEIAKIKVEQVKLRGKK